MSEMWEANLTFKREEREGIVPVGSYLADAAGRLGLRPERKCVPFENIHFCKVSVLEGTDILSPKTAHETEFLATEQAGADERLGCQTKITEPGDVVLMTAETKEEKVEAEHAESAKGYAKEFAELPLEKKIAELVNLEAIAFGETVSFIFNSPFLIFDKAMDVMAEFGLKKEEQGRKATRPAEHTAESAPADDSPDAEADAVKDKPVEATDGNA